MPDVSSIGNRELTPISHLHVPARPRATPSRRANRGAVARTGDIQIVSFCLRLGQQVRIAPLLQKT